MHIFNKFRVGSTKTVGGRALASPQTKSVPPPPLPRLAAKIKAGASSSFIKLRVHRFNGLYI